MPALSPVSNCLVVERTANSFGVFSSNPQFDTSGSDVDDAVVKVAMGLTGAHHLPFPVHFYGKNYKSMWMSTNGNVQFGSAGTNAYSNDCLPSASITSKMVAPFWDDLYLRQATTDNVYTKTTGSGANKRFIIYWNVVLESDRTTPVQVQLVFFANQNTISFVYNVSGGGSATIGVQNGANPYKQFACNSGSPTQVQPLLRVDFVR